jgi:hypothetical protein
LGSALPCALLLAALAAGQALAQDAPSTNEACAPRLDGAPLSPEIAATCRAAFQRRIEEDRLKVDAWRREGELSRAERARLRLERGRGRAAPLDSFLSEELTYGDIVVTDEGPRIFVGRADAAPRREDFVPLDSPRSPRRRDAQRLLDATRPR